jgi:hypothetical protein
MVGQPLVSGSNELHFAFSGGRGHSFSCDARILSALAPEVGVA